MLRMSLPSSWCGLVTCLERASCWCLGQSHPCPWAPLSHHSPDPSLRTFWSWSHWTQLSCCWSHHYCPSLWMRLWRCLCTIVTSSLTAQLTTPLASHCLCLGLSGCGGTCTSQLLFLQYCPFCVHTRFCWFSPSYLSIGLWPFFLSERMWKVGRSFCKCFKN